MLRPFIQGVILFTTLNPGYTGLNGPPNIHRMGSLRGLYISGGSWCAGDLTSLDDRNEEEDLEDLGHHHLHQLLFRI